MAIVKPSVPYEYTSLKTILSKAKLDLRLDHTTSQDIYLINYITRLAPEMKTGLDFVELTSEPLEINNYMVKTPCGFVRLDRKNPITFTTNGQADCNGYYNYFDIVYTGGPYVTCNPHPGFECGYGPVTINVQDGYICFSNNIGATECVISYLSVNMDESGEMKIPLPNERPLIEGVKWMYKMDEGQPESAWYTHRQLWVNGKGDRRGEANQPDAYEQAQISRIMNSMFY